MKDILGYEGLYTINQEGTEVLNKLTSKQLTIRKNVYGYYYVILSKEGVRSTKFIHRLVAQTYIPNPDNLATVDHLDEDKSNNNVNNLEWCSREENIRRYHEKDGRAYQKKLADMRLAKLKTVEQELRNKERELVKLHKELLAKEELIAKQKVALDNYAEQLSNTKHNYEGYANTKGIKFDSVDDLVAATGKRVKVNGIEYRSCKAAAEHIVAEELKLGNNRTKATVDKELRRFLQGLRPAWTMYGRYVVDYAK